MSDLSFTPTFHHKAWIDNVDRVKAAGQDGFNVRFEAIESDLRQVATVVASIGTLLGQAGSAPPAGTRRLLVPLATTNNTDLVRKRWTFDITGAIHPEPDAPTREDTGEAMMDLSLPDGITLTSMRVIGLYQSGTAEIHIRIFREVLLPPVPSANLLVDAALTPPGPGNPYDLVTTVDAQFAAVDNDKYRYMLSIESDSVSANDTISVDSIQLNYDVT